MAGETANLNVKFTGDSSGVVRESKQAEGATERYGRALKKTTGRQQRFGRGASSARRALKGLGGGLKTATKLATGLGLAFGAVAAFAFVRFVKEGARVADVLAKQATNLGISTEKLATYSRAADVVGVSQEKVVKTIQKLNKSILDASQGLTTSVRGFEALGLKVEDLINLKPEEAFEIFAKKINSIESPLVRGALAMQLAGKSAAEMQNFFALTTDQMEEFAEQARIAGTALTKETAAGIERANDAMGSLSLLSSGLQQQLAVQFAPTLEAIANNFFNMAEEAGGMGKVAEDVFNFLVKGAAKVANVIDGIKVAFNFVSAAVSFLQETFASLISGMLAGAVGVVQFFNEDLAKKLAKLSNSFAKQAIIFGKEAEKSWDEAVKSATEYGDAGDAILKFVIDAEKAQRKLTTTIEDFNVAGISTASIVEAISIETRGAKEATDAWSKALQDTAARIDTAFADAWRGAFDSFESFRDKLLDAFKNLLAEMAHLAITRPILMQIAATFGGALATGAAGTAAGAVLGGGAGGAGAGGGGAGGLLSGVGTSVVASSLQGRFASLLAQGANAFGFSETGGAILRATGFQSAGQFGAGGTLAGPATAQASLVQNVIGGLATIGAGLAGSFVGTKIGTAVTGKTPNSGIGATIGSIVGAVYFNAIGAAVGGAIGGFVDSLFGSEKKNRFNAGVIVGGNLFTQGKDGSISAQVRGESGLGFQSFARRSDPAVAKEMLDSFLAIDSVLTELSRSIGIQIDFTNKIFGQGQTSDFSGGPTNFFGVKGQKGRTVGNTSLAQAADDFVIEWISLISDQLPKRVKDLIGGVQQTAQEIVTAFVAAVRIDELLSLDIVNKTEEAIEAILEQVENTDTLTKVYRDASEAVVQLAMNTNSSASSLTNLADALLIQKEVAIALVAALRVTSISVDEILGNLITNIADSLLTPEELFAQRRTQIGNLGEQLRAAEDPQMINDLVSQIAELTNLAFSSLSEAQQSLIGPEFIDFLTATNELAQQRIDASIATINATERDLAATIDAELATAATNLESSNTFSGAVTDFASIIARINATGGEFGGVEFAFSELDIGNVGL